MVPGTAPEEGVIVSQFPPLAVVAFAVKVKPMALLLILIVRVVGEATPPTVAVKFNAFGATTTFGLDGPRMRRKTWAVALSVPDFTVTDPAYMPTLRPVGSAFRVIVPLPEPEVGVIVSHLPPVGEAMAALAVHVNVPPPAFFTFNV